MDKLASITLPYLKAYGGFAAGWLATNLNPEMITAAGQWVGVSIPESIAGPLAGLIVAGVVWLIPNKKMS